MSVLKLLVMESASIAAVVSAGVIAYAGKDGWGWFLVIGMLLSVSSSTVSSGKEPPK